MNHAKDTHPPVFTAPDARAAGYSRKQIRRRTSRNIAYNVYETSGLEYSEQERLIAIARTMPGCALASFTAARLLGFRLPRRYQSSETVDVLTCNISQQVRRRNVRASRAHVNDSELLKLQDYTLTNHLRTLLDIALHLTYEELVGVIDGLLVFHPHRRAQQFPVLTRRDIEDYLATKRKTKAVIACKQALRVAVTGSDSWKETELRLLLERHGVTGFESNRPVMSSDGRILIEPDLGDFERKVSVQYEGVHHAGREQIRVDVRRQRKTVGAGWVEVRIFSEDLEEFVFYEGAWVPRAVMLVRAALALRPGVV